MAKARLFELPETRGFFQLKGIVSGTEKENFYKESRTKTGKDMRRVNFGVEYDNGKTMYVTMQGMPMEKAYFSKQGKNGEKSETVAIAWADRHTYKREGFRLIGSNIGVTKTVDQKGNSVNNKKLLTDFDSCKEVGENLKDEQSVFIKGKLEFSSFEADNGDLKRSTKLIPTQVSLCQDIKFDDDKFESAHDFTQTIIFTGIEQEKEDDKPTGRAIVSAKIITYSSIEDAEFVVANSALITIFRKNLKPYNAIEVWGRMEVSSMAETIEDTDDWGEPNGMERQNAPVKREFVITGAKKDSLDKDTYTQELVEAAMVKVKNSKNAVTDYADSDNDGWGSSSSLSGSADDECDW